MGCVDSAFYFFIGSCFGAWQLLSRGWKVCKKQAKKAVSFHPFPSGKLVLCSKPVRGVSASMSDYLRLSAEMSRLHLQQNLSHFYREAKRASEIQSNEFQTHTYTHTQCRNAFVCITPRHDLISYTVSGRLHNTEGLYLMSNSS